MANYEADFRGHVVARVGTRPAGMVHQLRTGVGDVVLKKKKAPGELRREFIEKAWEILWNYLERLAETALIEATDARASAGVVKTLLEGIDRAHENLPEENPEIELPEIPEKALEEALRICFPELLPGSPAAQPRRARTGVSDRPAASPVA